MNLSRRTLLRGALATAGSAGVAACARSGAPAAAPHAPAPAAVAGKVSWLVRNTQFEVDWENNVAIPDFAKQSPRATVDLLVSPGGDYDAKLTAMVVGGSSPDVWTHWGGRSYVDYLHNGWLEDLTTYTSRDKVDLGGFLPNTVDWFKKKGKVYALPFSQSYGSFVYYNKNLLAAAGLKPPPADPNDKSWTWDAMIDVARKLTANAGTPQATYGLLAFADSAQFLSQTLAKL
jgi:multiple sugar transport system substrate-binding protein